MAGGRHVVSAEGLVGLAGHSGRPDHELWRNGPQLQVPKAMRAVGHANGANPISVVLPCHRLIGSDGKLVKYGGGLARKRWLLRHEGVEV